MIVVIDAKRMNEKNTDFHRTIPELLRLDSEGAEGDFIGDRAILSFLVGVVGSAMVG